MVDVYVARLLQMIEDEVNHTRWDEYSKPCDNAIDDLLNNICTDLGLSLRFKRINTDLLKIIFDNIEDEVLMFPEVVARFREEYPMIVGCRMGGHNG